LKRTIKDGIRRLENIFMPKGFYSFGRKNENPNSSKILF